MLICQAINSEILADCERKAGQSLLDLLRKATSAMSPDPEAAYELFHECVRLKHEAKVSRACSPSQSHRVQ